MGCSNDNLPNNWPNWQGNARSLHSNGVNCVFGDGSIRAVRVSTPGTTLALLSARNDGQPIPDY